MTKRIVRIGAFSAFWGDTPEAARQLLRVPDLEYLIGDYLAEVTMALLARARQKTPDAGYTPDFVATLAPLVASIAARGIKVITNAGGMNPRACRAALEKAALAAGVDLKVAIVEGDDLMPDLARIRAAEPREMFTDAPMPDKVLSMNAYLGARPIALALSKGAQVVITGRCVDSALVLGALVHEFGWDETDYDRLSAGSLAGHLVECGTQCTGGNFTDWQHVPRWDDMGFPVAECEADGTFTITKPEGTGGLVSRATVGEQLLYEIGDPSAYVLPDVICDWTQVRLEPDGRHRVRVEGALGRAPTDSYKVCATHTDGYRSLGTLLIAGFEAGEKALRHGLAIVARVKRLVAEAGMKDFAETSVEVVGLEQCYGQNARATQAREAVVKVAVRHATREGAEIFARELAPSVTSMAQGTTGFGGRPEVVPVVRVFSFLAAKTNAPARVSIATDVYPVEPSAGGGSVTAGGAAFVSSRRKIPDAPREGVTLPLRRLAWARSGDKGNRANIGVMARRPEFVVVIREQVHAARVAEYFAHYLHGEVRRWELPGIAAFNYVLDDVLGGGGLASLRYDPLGKTLAALLLDITVQVPDHLIGLAEPSS